MKDWLEIFRIDASSKQLLPYADEGIQAGFPSPAQLSKDYDNCAYQIYLIITSVMHNTLIINLAYN